MMKTTEQNKTTTLKTTSKTTVKWQPQLIKDTTGWWGQHNQTWQQQQIQQQIQQ